MFESMVLRLPFWVDYLDGMCGRLKRMRLDAKFFVKFGDGLLRLLGWDHRLIYLYLRWRALWR